MSVDYVSGGTQAKVTYLVWIDKRQFPTEADFLAYNQNAGLRPFDFFDDGNGFVYTGCANSFDGDDDTEFGYAQVVLKQGAPQSIFSQLMILDQPRQRHGAL